MSHGALPLVIIVSVAVSTVSASNGAGSASLGISPKRQTHANDYHTTPIGIYTENVYWNSRKRSDELRAKRGALESLTSTSLQEGVSERVWDLFYPDYNCPLVKERVGRIGDGGKWVCGLGFFLQRPHCLVYSLGSAGDTSFEENILSKTPCEVHTFDHTLTPDVQEAVESMQGLTFHPIGIGSSSQNARLQQLHQIMSNLGHQWIDILKIDIEGAEWEVFNDLYAQPNSTLSATQVLVEFHFQGNMTVVLQTFDRLLADNYRVFAVEPNYYCQEGCCARDLLEFAFVKVSARGEICTPHVHSSLLPPGC